MRQRLIICTVFLFIFNLCFAHLQPETFSYKTFFKKDGLPNNFIYFIKKSSDGFLWIGSQGGIARYDGRTFKAYNVKNTPEFSVDDVVDFYEINKDKILITTSNEILNLYHGNIKKIADFKSAVTFIKKDINNHIVIGSYNNFSIFKNNSLINYSNILKDRSLLYGFYANKETNEMFLCTSKGLKIIDNEYKIKQELGKNIYFYKIVFWNNSLIVCSEKGFFQILKSEDKWSLRKIEKLPNVGIFKLAVSEDGILYGMSNRHIYQIFKTSLTELKVEMLKTPFEIEKEFRDIFIDNKNNIWVSTKGGSFVYFKSTFKSFYSFKNIKIQCFYKDSFGNILVGTEKKGVFHIFENKIVNQYLNGRDINNVFIDSKRRFWISTKYHLFIVKKNKLREIFDKSNKPILYVFSIFENKKGEVIFSQDDKIVKYKNNKLTEVKSGFYVKNGIRSIVQGENSIYLGTSDGLFKLKENKIHEVKNNGKSVPYVFELYFDKENTLFLGTDEGLLRYKDNKFSKITFQDGLITNWVSSIVEDDFGNLWLGTDGVQVVKKTQLNDYFDGLTQKLKFRNYGVEDGLPSINLAAGYDNIAYKDKDGKIYYCTDKGLAVVNPSEILVDKKFPNPFIDTVLVEGKKVDKYKPVLLKPNEKRIEFQYTAPKFFKNNLLQFKVNLKGFDNVWKISKERKISYTNLSPGDYEFQVKTSNSEGKWGEKIATFKFNVIRPFYMKWWFYFIFVLLCFIVLTYLLKFIKYLVKSALFMQKSRFVGPYKIIENIGTGGMGVVYKAISLEDKKVVALKVLNENVTDIESKKRFIQEGIICEKINHKNVVKIYGRGEHRNRLYFAMEYCKGETLRNVLIREKLPVLKALWVFSVLIDILHDLHSEGIIHRDIKPENIMLTNKFDLTMSRVNHKLLPNLKASIKLLDFGLAKAVGNTALTRTGLLAGTVYYLPPESIQQRLEFYPEADIYAAGVLFYEMITGLKPFEGDDIMEVMYKVMDLTPVSPIEVDNSISKNVSDFADRLLVKDTDKRLSDVNEIRKILEILIKNEINSLN